MKLLNIKPCDNTFFGDGNQFKFGMNNFIRSKNTPYPSVFFGAIFTSILSQNDEFRSEFFKKGKYDHEELLELHQVYLYNNTTEMAYISAPKDLFINSQGKKVFGEFKKVDNALLASISYERILQSPEDSDYKRVSNKYINIEDINDLYSNKISQQIELINENDVFIKNNKVGIKIDKATKSVEEGMLYKIEQTEFLDDIKENNNWSYLVEYEIYYNYLNDNYNRIEIQELDKGYLKLGGENKVCRFEKMENDFIKNFTEKKVTKLNQGIYKVIFTSDTFFKEDIKKAFGQDIKILGIASDKPIYIGGFDMESGIRKMYKGYAAGTVVLIEVINENSQLRIKSKNSKGFNEHIVVKEGI
ncbi:type III-B CRISPR module-associated Cmr3 family protein [Clostridium guangxiense]|uniref:type III-B CRISPR module-associated Cmr3 family protein n=1 Tax=Clostridium guangxiense TaxID=1662055 RepID=UPI001E48D77E|nr:type III-B CRISPR module-associated Cmr3 family protein [Clostridium guangxiense]MCD2348051.1 CRISPR-associated protein Cmr3 [Clostridium guangxiense]